ncbi:ATP-grasp domain-containing protein [Kordia sp. YSTF-M3]|uniref:ATP-grasp domain-containing protein n=1 Tax=Kordia aestuariivivens TaxID=2759037 RepID=A0ABR7QF13_9FLAO|nr:ATP-grasp domain-containing protein [Kordia aestuariivivens]MBC8757167.1 ATP-grasp domain-containing protein [Kordia aestuariivivens]
MKTILVVNGENYWKDIMPDFNVVQKLIQHTSWILKEGKLFVVDAEGVVEPDAILWRVGAIKPTEIQTTALNLIELSGIPCVNSPETLKIGFDRLSMLATIKNLDLPVIDFNVVTKSTHLKNIKTDFPFVVKVGNYHGGYGKVLVEDEKKWQDIKDLLFVTEHYITIEPFIDYVRDIRYIAIDEKVWAMSRRGKYWKANVETTDYEEFEPEVALVNDLKRLQNAIGADIIAVDILEEENGKIHIVEYNDIPGLSGFSDELKYELASVISKTIS